MIKRILNLMRQDLTNTLRDNILLYMLFGPILLTIGARLFLPSLDQASLTFAVQEGVEPAVVQRLNQIGNAQTYPDAEAVKARVLLNDDVPGLVLKDSVLLLVLEGNESEGPEVLSGIIGRAISGETISTFSRTEAGGARSLLTEITAIIFIMIVMLLGALIMAFNIIEDKETRAIHALGVSPLSMLELTLARGLFALLAGLALVFITTAILLGANANYGLLLVAFLFSLGLPILAGYVIGGLADSQLKAIAVLKFFMLVYLTLPILSVFLPRQWHVFLYILPNYWMWQTFENALIGQLGGVGLWGAGLITLLSNLALVAVLLPLLRRQLKLR